MFCRITLTITEQERDALRRLAERELRPTKEQARVAIRKLLIEHGELPVTEDTGAEQRQPVARPA